MDKRKRVLHAFQNKPVDRPPVGFWFHFPPEKAKGKACIDAHLAYYRESGIDFLKVMSDGYFEYPLPDSIKTPADWDTLEPLPASLPYIQEQLERAKKIRKGLGQDVCIFYNVFAPFSSIRFGSSEEFVMQSLEENPQGLCYALGMIARTNALLSQLLIQQAGMDGIYYCVQGGEQNRFSPSDYRNLIGPSDRFVLNHANQSSLYNILHCCGWAGVKNNLEVWQDYPAGVFNWATSIEGMDLREGRQFFGKPVLGGFDNRPSGLLYSGTKESIQTYTQQLIQSTGTSGILLGADCTLPGDIDIQHIRWVVEAVESCAQPSKSIK